MKLVNTNTLGFPVIHMFCNKCGASVAFQWANLKSDKEGKIQGATE
jgi:hypothetical protein